MEQLDRIEHKITTVERMQAAQAESVNLLRFDVKEINAHLEQIDATVNRVKAAEKVALFMWKHKGKLVSLTVAVATILGVMRA